MKVRECIAGSCLCLAVAVFAQSSGLEVTNLDVSKTTLGKNKIAAVRFSLPKGDNPWNWRLSCQNAEIDGWESTKPVHITDRNSDGKITVVEGKNIPAGTRLMVNLRRPATAKKGESGKCKVTVFPGTESGPKDADQGSYITLNYK